MVLDWLVEPGLAALWLSIFLNMFGWSMIGVRLVGPGLAALRLSKIC